MPRTLFVSDVHLRARDPANNLAFLKFLEQDYDALYVVGDLFDFWIGPKHLGMEDYRHELELIRKKTRGCPIFFIKGNRDYLVEEKFEKQTGMTILGDRARIDLGGRSVLLAHGDFIYNTNPKYTAYRTMMRSKPIEDLWLQVPSFVGRTLARGFRKVSRKTTPPYVWKKGELFDRARPFFEQGADVLITGHIHLPTHLKETLRGRVREVFIMGDWCGGTQDYVEHDGREFAFKPWPLRAGSSLPPDVRSGPR
jgi:UDP-2,3-diacylglucosamine hydrolase